MVQIQLPEQEKQVVEEERRAGVEAGQVGEDPLLPTTIHHSINKRQRQQATSKRSVFKYFQPSFSSESFHSCWGGNFRIIDVNIFY